MSVSPSLRVIFIVHLIPGDLQCSPGHPQIGNSSAVVCSLLPFFHLQTFSLWDVTSPHTNSLVIWEKQISELHCSWLCNVQLWCFCLGPIIHGLFWGIIGAITSFGEVEKGKELGGYIVISPEDRENAAEAGTWWAV